MKRIFLFLLSLSVFTISHAQLRLPSLFDDHMVLQQQSPAPIWGWAHPSQDIVINVSWDTTTIKTKADNTTYWSTTIFTPPAGGPYTITIKAGGEVRTLQDVLIGEVWLCSGQSNMEWSMESSGDGKEMISQVNDPKIRLFHVSKSAASFPQVHGEGKWKACNPEGVKYFSAVGYFFGKKLNQNLNVPIGLINVSWGGTPAETWVPEGRILADPALKASAEKQIDDRPWCPSRPGVVYNSMINPIVPFRIAGTLWYQGESNTGAPETYKHLMETMVTEWRRVFLTEFPFYFVQIAPYSGYGDESGVLLREQQVEMLQIPKSGIVVISDLVDNVKDIHPKYKKPVGERLANLALAQTYGQKNIGYQSPVYKSFKIEKGRIRISFDYATNGLMSKGGEPTEFQIAGADNKFYPAKAKIDGNTVVVSAKEVKTPVAVRFAWSNAAMPNLFSKEGLPVPSFHTDK
ncbi:sialate O-acetylesterase [Ohtaekwangia koreensis]|uniref:Sialate O-acetylesterase n=1 Tax=Ohtaekwangia koreensis TaxID=688867 RepID=A0A1T5JBJ3_9BACT|nr:sialate O-acetylesterase [Ohtaekwangia koreensis]SKC48810.1 sialate O-acetylesterase [Ohtaekwangia koreensis]